MQIIKYSLNFKTVEEFEEISKFNKQQEKEKTDATKEIETKNE